MKCCDPSVCMFISPFDATSPKTVYFRTIATYYSTLIENSMLEVEPTVQRGHDHILTVFAVAHNRCVH